MGIGKTLGETITDLGRQPQVAKLILPFYIAGIGTMLQCERIHAIHATTVLTQASPVDTGRLRFKNSLLASG